MRLIQRELWETGVDTTGSVHITTATSFLNVSCKTCRGGKRLMILNRDPLSSHPFSHCHVTTSPKSHYNPTQKAHTHTYTQ